MYIYVYIGNLYTTTLDCGGARQKKKKGRKKERKFSYVPVHMSSFLHK